MQARGYAREECIAVGDSREDLETRPRSGASSWWRTPTPRLGRRPPRHSNVEVTEGANGEGFYEAVVRALAEADSS